MKKIKCLAIAIAVGLICACFTGCDVIGNSLFGVDIKIINDTDYSCEIKYTDYIDGSTDEDSEDEEFLTKITVCENSKVIIHAEYGTRLKLVPDTSKLETYTSNYIYEDCEYTVSEICN